ncbi:hypothetical protein DGMP_06610 [Desulfomarina profundi]|uniref:Major tail protein n=1 Tax=Desulfomarina profundi TaxID=2772557 RepID=A0A8D5FES3_9BACT|nr:hypothetical protein [Desulfomarina profundi]BCL59968.1 hypothetical protein DGMP_06610 [Desulfomarina profundi]
MEKKAWSATGTVYLAALDENKNPVGGFREVGNVYPLSLKVETEIKKQISRMKGTAGQTLHTKASIKDITGTMNVREWNAKNLAWALSGEEVAMTATAGSVAAESITVVLDEWIKLGHEDISNLAVTGHTAGTDFLVNESLGLFKALSSGGISAGDLDVAYDYAAESGYRVDIGTRPLIRVAMLVDGENEYDGSPFIAKFDAVVLSANAEISFISDPGSEYDELPFSLSFETLPGKTSPGSINKIAM